jgi:hypothetical protein
MVELRTQVPFVDAAGTSVEIWLIFKSSPPFPLVRDLPNQTGRQIDGLGACLSR